jgi:hypothetical protein
MALDGLVFFSNFSTPSTVIFRFCIFEPARCGNTVVELFGRCLRNIFQKSVDCGTLPNDWLSANTGPVFKKGDVHAAENYRPVSILMSLNHGTLSERFCRNDDSH